MGKTTKEAAHGRWGQILPTLGVSSEILRNKAQPCPMCGGKDRFVFDDRYGNGDYFCRKCGAGDGFHLLQKLNGWDFRQACREVDKLRGLAPAKTPRQRRLLQAEDVIALWGKSRPLEADDPVTGYLRRRAINLPVWPKALRYMPDYKHTPSKRYLPCMLAAYRAANGDIGTIHRTYLAEVTPNRMFLPTAVPVGGSIQLFAPAETMGVAEGIETALSAAILFRMPVWATTSERLLRTWQPPPGTRNITVFGDNDANFIGQAAAYHCANRLVLRTGYEVRVRIPEQPGWDWNDVLDNEIETERFNSNLSQLWLRDRRELPDKPVSGAEAKT